MTVDEVKTFVKSDSSYDFLKTDKHLGSNIICLGLGGSYAYGTNNEDSDIDVRGVALNSYNEILLGKDFEQVVDKPTDTVIYSLKKIFRLLALCNPNTIEILGLSDNQYIKTTDIWDEVRKNKRLFLSKRCIATFGGYAQSQLRRLETKSARELGQAQREKYIFGSIKNAEKTFKQNYAKFEEDTFKLYIDESVKEDYDTEIMVDINLEHYPLRDLGALINDYHSIVRNYDKIGKRNSKAIEHDKLGKHMAHLVRLYFMVFDILKEQEIITYRKDEHEFLMSVRNGDYLIDGVEPKAEFFKIIDDLDARFNELKSKTKLPDEPDYDAIVKLYIKIVKNNILTLQ